MIELKIYLASSFSLVERVKWVCEYLEMYGHEVTVKWWEKDFKTAFGNVTDDFWYGIPGIKEIHDRNFKGIDDADVLILIAPKTEPRKFNGANIEVGYALARGKRVMAFGNIERSAMYWAVEPHTHINYIVNALKSDVR